MRPLLIFVLAAAMAAQTPPKGKPADDDASAIRVDVDVVSILASVRDKRGALIPNLEQTDFTVFEDGKPQTIKYFARETDLPLTIGLLVDVSRSQENLIAIERNAASEFFTQVLRSKDEAFLISFGEESELLQDFTNSPRLLTAGLKGLRVSGGVSGLGPGPVPTVSQPRGTVLFDAVYLAATEKLKSEVGRKAVVVITDGVDQGSKVDVRKAIEAAQRSDAVIYSIDYSDPGFYARAGAWGMGGGDGDLRKMSEETGGRVFKVDRRHPLEQVFKELQEEMRSQYMIGYTPANAVRDGQYHKIDLKMSNKDLKPQARKGYFAVKPETR
jgi:VWFA-related protein